jgi:hypothetical protein
MKLFIYSISLLFIFLNSCTSTPNEIKNKHTNEDDITFEAAVIEIDLLTLQHHILMDSIRYLNTKEKFDDMHGKEHEFSKDYNKKIYSLKKETLVKMIDKLIVIDSAGFLTVEFGIEKKENPSKTKFENFNISIGGRSSKDSSKISNSFISISGNYDSTKNTNIRELYKMLYNNGIAGYEIPFGGVIYPLSESKKWIENVEDNVNTIYLTPTMDIDDNGNGFTSVIFSGEKLNKKEILRKKRINIKVNQYSTYGDKGTNCCQ